MDIEWDYNNDGCETGLEPAEHEVVVKIPFIGTYCSLDDYIESYMERERERYEQEENPPDQVEYSFDLGQFCKDYVEWLADSLGLKTLRFQKMTSPAYYNFETDKIWCIIDKSELWELYKKVKNDPQGSVYLQAEIGEATTSRDGYRAFYMPEDCEWSKADDFDDTCSALLGLIMDAACHMWLDDENHSYDDPNSLLLSAFDLIDAWNRFYDQEFYTWLDQK